MYFFNEALVNYAAAVFKVTEFKTAEEADCEVLREFALNGAVPVAAVDSNFRAPMDRRGVTLSRPSVGRS
jgi:hypothetical protein